MALLEFTQDFLHHLGLGQERTDFKLNDLFLPIDGQMTERHRWNVIPLK